MNTILYVSIAFNVLFIIFFLLATSVFKEVIEKNMLLTKQTDMLMRERTENYVKFAQENLKLSERAAKTTALNAKTISLIKLAVSNANENEERTAAMAACKSLLKDLK